MSLFCRHNRFTADCPICSKGTVLDRDRKPARRERARAARRPATASERTPASRAFAGPHVAGPVHVGEDGSRAVVRLERVPGGVRLGEWSGSALAPRAPVLDPQELADLVERAGEALTGRDATRLVAALAEPRQPDVAGDAGVSRGRSGDFHEELRVERLDDGRLRVARWLRRPATGWQLQDAPPMLPAARYAEALADAARRGLIAPSAPSDAAAGA